MSGHLKLLNWHRCFSILLRLSENTCEVVTWTCTSFKDSRYLFILFYLKCFLYSKRSLSKNRHYKRQKWYQIQYLSKTCEIEGRTLALCIHPAGVSCRCSLYHSKLACCTQIHTVKMLHIFIRHLNGTAGAACCWLQGGVLTVLTKLSLQRFSQRGISWNTDFDLVG